MIAYSVLHASQAIYQVIPRRFRRKSVHNTLACSKSRSLSIAKETTILTGRAILKISPWALNLDFTFAEAALRWGELFWALLQELEDMHSEKILEIKPLGLVNKAF